MEDPSLFLAHLANEKRLVVPGKPKESGIFALMDCSGPMYMVFNDTEQKLWSSWIRGLPSKEPAGQVIREERQVQRMPITSARGRSDDMISVYIDNEAEVHPVTVRPERDARTKHKVPSEVVRVADSTTTPMHIDLPFGSTALHVAQLESLRNCATVDYDGPENPFCEKPYGAALAWNYALNNLMATGVPEHGDLANDVALLQKVTRGFFQRPSQKTYSVLMQTFQDAFGTEHMRTWLNSHPSTAVNPDQHPVFARGRLALQAAGRTGSLAQLAPTNDLAGTHLGTATTTLSGGIKMPLMGFGTWQLEGEDGVQAVKWALEGGYRHIDTAQDYTNEADVGRGIAASGVPRADIFLVTKLSELEDYKPGRVAARFEQQLEDLQTDYMDLYMLHNPADDELTLAAWRQLEDLHSQGKIRALGVSNFNETQLNHLLEHAKVPPVYVQNKFSIYSHGSDDYDSVRFLNYLREKRIALVGYSLINPFPYILPPLDDPHVFEVARTLR